MICLSLAIILSLDVRTVACQFVEYSAHGMPVCTGAIDASVLARDLTRDYRVRCRYRQLEAPGRQSVRTSAGRHTWLLISIIQILPSEFGP